MSFTPYDRPVRAAFIGLGRIYDLNVLGYLDNPEVEVVALVDQLDAERRDERAPTGRRPRRSPLRPSWRPAGLRWTPWRFCSPPRFMSEAVAELLGYGWHVNLQKPMCNDLDGARLMLDAARANNRLLRVMENYVFYEPLIRLKEVVESDEIGTVSGYHMKMVASGRGGWDVPANSFEWQFRQMRAGRGILVFDDGWHKMATAHWLFGPVEEVRAWLGGTEVVPGITLDAPATIMWEHENGVHGVWDITLATDMYLRSDYYTNDERWEVTGREATPGSTGARGAAFSSRASRSTSTARCARTTRSTTTGRAASATRVCTGFAISAPGRAPCSGAGGRRPISSGSPWPPTPAVRQEGSGSAPRPSVSSTRPERPSSDWTRRPVLLLRSVNNRLLMIECEGWACEITLRAMSASIPTQRQDQRTGPCASGSRGHGPAGGGCLFV